MFISQNLVDALINIGYEMHIFDKDGDYPRGLSRDQWEAEETAKAIVASQPEVQADAGCTCKNDGCACEFKDVNGCAYVKRTA